MDLKTLAQLYRPGCRVELDWERGLQESWPVSLEVISGRAEAERLLLPWSYRNGDPTQPGTFSDGGRPLRAGQINAALPGFSAKRQAVIESYRRSYAEHRGTPVVPVACWQFPSGERFVIDGTHHLSALLLADCPFRLALFVVAGSADSGCPHIESVRVLYG